MEEEVKAHEAHKKRNYDWLIPYQFKIGNNANPGGRPKGSKSLKTYAREYLETLPDDEKIKYLNSLDRDFIWKMAEGQPKQDIDANVEVTSKVISIDE